MKKIEVALRDIDSFYNTFVNKKKLSDTDLDARLEKPKITNHFRIHRTEYAIRLIGKELPPNRYNFYFVSLLTKGSATKTDWLSEFKLKPRTLWGTPLGQLHSARDWSEDASGYYISFSKDFLFADKIILDLIQEIPLFQFDSQHFLHLSIEDSNKLYAMFERLEKEFGNGDLIDELRSYLLKLHLAELLITVKLLFDKAPSLTSKKKKLTSLSDKFRVLIEKCFLKEKSVTYYAGALMVHPNHLNSVCKSETGITASDLIRERVLTEAKALLYQSDLSIKEIAYYLHFKDSAHFSKFFKNATSQNPQAYRRESKAI